MKMEGKDHNQAKKKGKGKIPPQGGIKVLLLQEEGAHEKGLHQILEMA